jgi:hypothetical protein
MLVNLPSLSSILINKFMFSLHIIPVGSLPNTQLLRVSILCLYLNLLLDVALTPFLPVFALILSLFVIFIRVAYFTRLLLSCLMLSSSRCFDLLLKDHSILDKLLEGVIGNDRLIDRHSTCLVYTVLCNDIVDI